MRREDQKNRTRIGPHLRQARSAESQVISVAKIGYVRWSEFRAPHADASRRFPPPWRADRTPHGYVVRDANGQAIAYIYSREDEAEARP